ncbi:MAG: A24 family peptidase [Eubacteriales bacterium]|nr:A24 family peptidase [Eubacteriales bacterium]
MPKLLTLISFFTLLAVIARMDQKTMKIPDGLVWAVAAVGAVSVFTMPETGLTSRIAGMLAVSLPILFISMAAPKAFGGGDIKLMAAGGLFLGARLIATAFVFGIVSGGICGLALWITGKKGRRDVFPFGPFLCAGMALGYFWGDAAWRWFWG